jgi:tetratricopeptide (TPR) repeat protein
MPAGMVKEFRVAGNAAKIPAPAEPLLIKSVREQTHLLTFSRRSHILNCRKQGDSAAMLADRHITALMHNARQKSKEGNWIASLNIYRHIIDERPGFLPVYCELARLYLDRDDLDGAREMTLKVTCAQPENTEAHFLLGVIEYIEGNFEAALRSYRVVEEIDGLDCNLALNIALVCEALGLHKDAIKNLEHALARGEANAKVYEVLSDLYRAIGDNAQAGRVLERALSKFPTDASLHYHLGLARLAVRNYLLAEASFQAAGRLSPDSVGPLEELAQLYLELERFEDAAAVLSQLTRLDILSAQNWVRLSRVYYMLGDYKKSTDILAEAEQILHDNASIHKELDRIRSRLKKSGGARGAPGSGKSGQKDD